MKKKIFIFISLLVLFQLIDFLFYRYFGYVINNRIIFGLVGNNIISIFISLLFLCLLYIVVQKQDQNIKYLFALISAATISNVLDRIIYGGVVDYIKISFIPTFNLSDVVIIVLLFMVFASDLKKTIRLDGFFF